MGLTAVALYARKKPSSHLKHCGPSIAGAETKLKSSLTLTRNVAYPRVVSVSGITSKVSELHGLDRHFPAF